MGPRAATVRNVSVSGMLVDLDGLFRPSDRLSFSLLGDRIGATVVAVDRGRVGLAFDRELSDRDLRLLMRS